MAVDHSHVPTNRFGSRRIARGDARQRLFAFSRCDVENLNLSAVGHDEQTPPGDERRRRR